jgi:hypothetical protein
MIDGRLWVWSGKEDGDLFEATVQVERTDVDEISVAAESNGQKPQTIYLTRFAAGQVAQALAVEANREL